MNTISPKALSDYLLSKYTGINFIQAWGEDSFFYNPTHTRPRGTYFCTIKKKDGEHDKASALYRDETYRFNFGVSKKTFMQLFGTIPPRPAKGGIIQGDYDFTAINTLQPHPVYGWMYWVAIINPTHASLESLAPFIDESYQLAHKRYYKGS